MKEYTSNESQIFEGFTIAEAIHRIYDIIQLRN